LSGYSKRRGTGKPGKKPVPGFAALDVIPDAATETLEQFLADKVQPTAIFFPMAGTVIAV
jgi:hypothetical protein